MKTQENVYIQQERLGYLLIGAYTVSLHEVKYCQDITYMYIRIDDFGYESISIFHGCMVWIEKSFTRVTDRHHEACRVMPNSDPE